MALDARIPLMVQPIKIPDALEGYGKAMTLAQMMGQLGDQRRARQDEMTARQIYRQHGDDFEGAGSALMRAGLPKQALTLRKEGRESEKAKHQAMQEANKIRNQYAIAVETAAPQDRPALYKQMLAELGPMGLVPKGAPTEYSDQVGARLRSMVMQSLSPELAAERSDFANPPQMNAPTAPPQAATMEQFTAPEIMPDQSQPVSRGTELDGGGLPVEPAIQRIPDNDVQGVPLPLPDAPQSLQDMFAVPPEQQPAAPQVQPSQTMNDMLAQAPQEEMPTELPQQDQVAKAPIRSTTQMEREALAWERKGTPGALKMAKMLRDEIERREKMAFEEDKFEYQQRKDEADREAQHGKTSQASLFKQKEVVLKLSDDFRQEPAVKSYRTVQPMIASMENAVKRDTAASDLDIVYAIAKIFDPDSVVREGEQLLVIRSGGLPSSVQSALGWVVGGQRLSSDLRNGLLEQARSRAENYRQAYDSVAGSYAQQADRWGVDVRDIVREHKVESSASKTERATQTQHEELKSKGIGSGTEQDPYKIKGDEGYDQLPSGSHFIGPDGIRRVKP